MGNGTSANGNKVREKSKLSSEHTKKKGLKNKFISGKYTKQGGSFNNGWDVL